MKKDSLVYIEHIIESIIKINFYTKGYTLNSFLDSSLVQDAVIRNFEIIGEATKNLSIEFRTKYPKIEWKKIAGMRDKLIHDYIGVDLFAVWAVVEDILPNLLIELQNIKNNHSQ